MDENSLNIRYAAVKKNSIVAALVNTLLGVIKIIVGLWGNSHALIADGFHSLSDLITDFLVVVASRYGSRSADIEHPYGHGRIETVATMIIALLLILVGIGILYDGIYQVLYRASTTPATVVIWIVILSIFVKELLYHYTRIVATQVKSELLHANAWHHRSDAASSVVVLIGVVGAILGILYLDAVAAVIVGLMIIHSGWSLGWASVEELIDAGVDEKLLAHIKHNIVAIAGVRAIHQLRTRSMHGRVLMDVHVLVDPKLSVSEGHHIAQQVHYTLMEQIDSIFDVTVHIDPENDEVALLNFGLPSRQTLLPIIEELCQALPGGKQILATTLHYISGKIELQIVLPATLINNADDLKKIEEAYQQALMSLQDISVVEILLGSGKINVSVHPL